MRTLGSSGSASVLTGGQSQSQTKDSGANPPTPSDGASMVDVGSPVPDARRLSAGMELNLDPLPITDEEVMVGPQSPSSKSPKMTGMTEFMKTRERILKNKSKEGNDSKEVADSSAVEASPVDA